MACWALLAVAAGAAARQNATVERWGRWEGTWAAANLPGNAFDVAFSVRLTPPPASDGSAATTTTTTAVRGFFDGGNQFKARYMPPALGTWSYRTISNATALDGQSGSFEVVAPRTALNHGPVIVVASPASNSTKLGYADETPFHAVGTTVYGMFGGDANRTARTLASLRTAPFNKVRIMAFPSGAAGPYQRAMLPYEPLGGVAGAASDLTRFNVKFWQSIERTVEALGELGVQADVVLFNLYMQPYPAGLACMGGPNASAYDMYPDTRFVRYIVARLASYRNVWWSLSNEWSQCSCKFADAAVDPCPGVRDFSDPGCGPDGSNSLAPDTPIWDALFQLVSAEDPSGHLTSIHNNGYLYNYSRPWVTHFSVQHTHNKPSTLWRLFGRKPFVWDEVKYEGNDAANWGSLSAPQMVQRFWWAFATGAYGGHGETLDIEPSAHCGTDAADGSNSWSGGGGFLCGQSPERIAWFRQYVENTTRHPPFENCEGDDDGFVQTLTCGTDYILFRFYAAHAFANHSFQYVNLPTAFKMRQELLQPWEMRTSVIWQPPPLAGSDTAAPPPPGAKVWGPARGAGWAPVGIQVDEDTLPHILTFTRPEPGSEPRVQREVKAKSGRDRWLDLPF
jgi:hypothetical protein